MTSDEMTREQLQIHAGYGRIQQELKRMYDNFMADVAENSQNYEGITADDAVIWFVEGLS